MKGFSAELGRIASARKENALNGRESGRGGREALGGSKTRGCLEGSFGENGVSLRALKRTYSGKIQREKVLEESKLLSIWF